MRRVLAPASHLESTSRLNSVTRKDSFCTMPLDGDEQWRLVAFINGGASKIIIEMSKSSIHRLPKFKGWVNKFLTKNAIFNTNLYLYK